MAAWSCDLGQREGFRAYEAGTSRSIEAAFQAGQPSARISVGGQGYIIDFRSMRQIQSGNSHRWRQVRRSEAPSNLALTNGDQDAGNGSYHGGALALTNGHDSADSGSLDGGSGDVVWCCDLGDDRGVQPYEASVSATIEQARQAGQGSVAVAIGGRDYIIDFRSMRQVRRDNSHRWRQVRRCAADSLSASPPSADPTVTAIVQTRRLNVRKLYHLTDDAAAKSILQTGFRRSRGDPSRNYKPMFGEFIYFAGSPQDCVGKARAVSSLADGVVLSASVQLGTVLVCSDGRPSAAIQAALGISSWNDLTASVLGRAGCQSVLGTQPVVSRDEYAVPSMSQVRSIKVAGCSSSGSQGASSGGGQLLPWWQWPQWAHQLSLHLGADMDEVERVAQHHHHHGSPQLYGAQPHGVPSGVRVNSAGRPIHENGRFMTYDEALSKGWAGPQAGSSGPQRGSQNFAPSSRTLSTSSPRGHGGSQQSHGRRPSSGGRAGNAWNDFQAANRGQGLSRSEMQSAYRRSQSQTSVRPGSGHRVSGRGGAGGDGRASNPWNAFQAALAGHGLSRGQMVQSYHAAGSGGHSAGRASNPWNAFQASLAGQGLSRADMVQAYRAADGGGHSSLSLSSPSIAAISDGRASNPWNAFQAANAGQGWSRAEMRAAYHASRD